MKKFYLLVIFLFAYNCLGMEASHRKCIVLPISSVNQDVLEFHGTIVKYLQGSDWCVSKSTNDLYDILKKYKDKLGVFIGDRSFRKKIVRKTSANTLIYFRNENEKYFLEIWDINGLIYKEIF